VNFWPFPTGQNEFEQMQKESQGKLANPGLPEMATKIGCAWESSTVSDQTKQNQIF